MFLYDVILKDVREACGEVGLVERAPPQVQEFWRQLRGVADTSGLDLAAATLHTINRKLLDNSKFRDAAVWIVLAYEETGAPFTAACVECLTQLARNIGALRELAGVTGAEQYYITIALLKLKRIFDLRSLELLSPGELHEYTNHSVEGIAHTRAGSREKTHRSVLQAAAKVREAAAMVGQLGRTLGAVHQARERFAARTVQYAAAWRDALQGDISYGVDSYFGKSTGELRRCEAAGRAAGHVCEKLARAEAGLAALAQRLARAASDGSAVDPGVGSMAAELWGLANELVFHVLAWELLQAGAGLREAIGEPQLARYDAMLAAGRAANCPRPAFCAGPALGKLSLARGLGRWRKTRVSTGWSSGAAAHATFRHSDIVAEYDAEFASNMGLVAACSNKVWGMSEPLR